MDPSLLRACPLRLASAVAATLLAASPVLAQSTDRASIADDGSEIGEPSLASSQRAMSDDGRFVVFETHADGVIPEDTNDWADIYLRDLVDGRTILVSRAADGGLANRDSHDACISADGSTVAYWSWASNLVAGDTNHRSDVFVWDRATALTTLLSVASDDGPANGNSDSPSLSADGQVVAFDSSASNLVAGDTNGKHDVFVRDRAASTTKRVNLRWNGTETNHQYISGPSLSGDGKVVVFVTSANLARNDNGSALDVYAVDVATTVPEAINVLPDGSLSGYVDLLPVFTSHDGRFVAFASWNGSLVPGDDDYYGVDAFLRDRLTQTTEMINLDSEGDMPPTGGAWWCGPMSADGRFVTFIGSPDGLVDLDFWRGVFVRDRVLGTTFLASRRDDSSPADDANLVNAISDDGRLVCFVTTDPMEPDDANARDDVFVRERLMTPASWSNYGTGTAGRHGVPTLALSTPPVINGPTDVVIGNSSGLWTVASILYGFERDSTPAWGGELLLVPTASIAVVLAPGTTAVPHEVPPEEWAIGVAVVLQVLELDPFAVDGISMTPGLDARPGY